MKKNKDIANRKEWERLNPHNRKEWEKLNPDRNSSTSLKRTSTNKQKADYQNLEGSHPMSPKQLTKFKKELFQRYYTKSKIEIRWDDCVNMDRFLEEKKRIDMQRGHSDQVPLTPLIPNGIMYMESFVDWDNKYPWTNEHRLRPCDFICNDVDPEKIKANNAIGIFYKCNLDIGEYSFTVVLFNAKDNRINYRPFLHFVLHNFNRDPDKMLGDAGYAPTGYEQNDVEGCFDWKNLEVLDTEYSHLPEHYWKQISNNVFQNWLMANYYLINFQRNIVVYNYDGKAMLERMKGNTRKQRQRKKKIILGNVYRIHYSSVHREADEREYRCTGGVRAGGWFTRRVKDDYWERYPEKLEEGESCGYRPVSVERTRELLTYLPPLKDDEIFIEVQVVYKNGWKRNVDLLTTNYGGFSANTYGATG